MLRIATALFLSASTASLAQSTNSPAHHQQHGVMVNHGDVMPTGAAVVPMQPGQAAFATIQEIVQILEADPRTDWSKVDIDALRQHLIDMNNVTLKASIQSAPVPGGIRFTAIGTGDVRDSIRRMVAAHAATMSGIGGWTYSPEEVEGGAFLTVLAPEKDLPKLKALGFIGVLTVGMHHQEHHLMIARGQHPHG